MVCWLTSALHIADVNQLAENFPNFMLSFTITHWIAVSGTFWLSMDDFDAGYLYQCKFRDEAEIQKQLAEDRYMPIRTVAVEGLPETPISYMKFR